MVRESANQALRQVRTLFALGAVGGLTDAQLVERFLGGVGSVREDAFAALVQRHGPMVLGVCRRTLSGSADAEDAYQAVFLVLARKAGAIRRVDGLRSWLYGVAVRTAKESGKRSARHRAREGGTMDESTAVSAPDEERGDLLALLDEEIDRLPSRYRDPLMLCELEGASRQDAARQLGLPEGTLSSRLARGRSLLRDRLSRRGVASVSGPFATPIGKSVNVALPGPLTASTVRLALKFAEGGATTGMVPVAVLSLAEGVLGMISAAKLKLILVATASLGAAACLTVGLAVAVGPDQPGPPADGKPPEAVAVDTEKKLTPQPVQVRGVILDEAGRPVAAAEVLAEAFTEREARGVSGADGSFAIPIRRHQVDGTPLLARSAEGDRLGVFRYESNLTKAAAEAPVRIVLKPDRKVVVRVADANQTPVPGAAVQVAGNNHTILDDAMTGPDGSATLRVPADAKIEWIFALKSVQGFDYAEYGRIDDQGRSQGGTPAANLPDSVALTLDGARTARINAVDGGGKPVAGVGFYPWLLKKEGRRSEVNVWSRIFTATTGPDGIATFDWLPPAKGALTFWPADENYAHRRVMLEEAETGPVTARLTRTEAIRGRVVHSDGSPAPGIGIRASGTGKGMDNGHSLARTAGDGSFEMKASPGEAYAVFVDDPEWTAPSRLDVVVLEGKPSDGVDFKLTRGTNLRGTVTVGPGDRPASDQSIQLIEKAGRAPSEVREEGDRTWREARRYLTAKTDALGHYSIRVGPGIYTLMGPPRTGDEKIAVKDETELIRDFRMPRPEKGTLTGRVVLAGAGDRGIAGAKVEIVAMNLNSNPFAVTADAEGDSAPNGNSTAWSFAPRAPTGCSGRSSKSGPKIPRPSSPEGCAVMTSRRRSPTHSRSLDCEE